MIDLNKVYLYRITHINNIPHILQFGITHRLSKNANPHFNSIGDNSLISKRNEFVLNNGNQLGQYIPFYFGQLSPMLFVAQKGFNDVVLTPPENIIYCITSVQKIIDKQLDFIFTDGHAIDSFSTQFDINDVQNIKNLIDFNAVKERYWGNADDLDLKRKKQAEFLVATDIDIDAILGFGVYNQYARNKLLTIGVNANQIVVKPQYYF